MFTYSHNEYHERVPKVEVTIMTKAQDRFVAGSYIFAMYCWINFMGWVMTDTWREGVIIAHISVMIIVTGAGIVKVWLTMHERLGKRYDNHDS